MADSSPYRVVRATWRDLFAVRRLERLVFPKDAYSLLELWLLLIWPGAVNLKAVHPGGAMAGFVSGGNAAGGGRTWIITLGVHPDHRRRGLGRRLLDECEARLKDPVIFLTVRASNTPAIRLYEEANYYRINVQPGYYPDGEDGIEMRKDRFGLQNAAS